MREIDTRDDFQSWLAGGPREPAAVQGLDLSAYAKQLTAGSFAGSLFLGCELPSAAAGAIVAGGGVVIPNLEEFEFQLHRAKLYSPEELFAGYQPGPDGYARTLDYRIYRQYLEQGRQAASIKVSLARRLHDHAITDALQEALAGRRVVAVMGGHGMERRDPFYRQIAQLSRQLTGEGYLLVSGGGPGAMEATHLGAYFAARPEEDLQAALQQLAVRPADGRPGKEYLDPDWLERAWRVRERYPIAAGQERATSSIGIPTWLYGHEPPAAFASQIAKYFANSVREDGLLEIAHHGVIFAPGSAGTTQEIFQDATQNHYGTTGFASPMILFGHDHWTTTRPVWPLLEKVSAAHPYGKLVCLTDDPQEIADRIRSYRPEDHRAQ